MWYAKKAILSITILSLSIAFSGQNLVDTAFADKNNRHDSHHQNHNHHKYIHFSRNERLPANSSPSQRQQDQEQEQQPQQSVQSIRFHPVKNTTIYNSNSSFAGKISQTPSESSSSPPISDKQNQYQRPDDNQQQSIQQSIPMPLPVPEPLSYNHLLNIQAFGVYVLYDNFENYGSYSLADGQKSPNGRWQNLFNGGGHSGVYLVGTSNHVFYEYPKTSTSPSETHANSVISTKKFTNFSLSLWTKTIKQLRQNSRPNPWEVAMVFFRATDAFHYYWFALKTNGIEMGKKQCDTCTNPYGAQQFLVTKSSPILRLNSWSHWQIEAYRNHIIVFVNSVKVIDYVDTSMSPKLASGAIVMYNEDAYVNFDRVYIAQ